MSFWPSKPTSVGLSLSSSKLIVAAMSCTKKGWEVIHLGSYPLPIERDLIRQLEKLSANGPLVSTLPASHLLSRTLDIRLTNPKEIAEALEFQAEPHLPYPIEESIIAHELIERSASMTRVGFSAVRKDHLKKHIDTLQEIGIIPDKITSLPHALAALVKHLSPDTLSKLIVHIDEKTSTVLVAKEGKLIASSSIAMGSADSESPVFKREISKLISALFLYIEESRRHSIFFVGEDSSLGQLLGEITAKDIQIPSFSPFSIGTSDLISYGTAIGAAVLGFESKGLDFRKKEFCNPRPFRRVKKALSTYFCLTLTLAATLFFFSSHALKKKESALSELANSFLQGQQVNVNEAGSWEEALTSLEQKLDRKKEGFPLLPKLPNVSEFVSWLATAPHVDALQFDKVNYHMVSFPTSLNKKSHYAVEVSLDFVTANPKEARSFYEMLLKQTQLIDSSKGVKWHQERNSYKASFFLKDKTRYTT